MSENLVSEPQIRPHNPARKKTKLLQTREVEIKKKNIRIGSFDNAGSFPVKISGLEFIVSS